MECFICFQSLDGFIGWSNFFSGTKTAPICAECRKNLVKLTGPRCRRCSRSIEEEVCSDCQRWEQRNEAPLEFNYSIYMYNDFMKDLVAKWKYRGDYQLAEVFAEEWRAGFQNHFSFLKSPLLVPIPLSEERLKERAFNQSKQLVSFLSGNTRELLTRQHSEKQSKKKRYERIAGKNPFMAKGPINKPVILVDDIYTTGTTLYHAAYRLKERGCPAVYGYTLIRG